RSSCVLGTRSPLPQATHSCDAARADEPSPVLTFGPPLVAVPGDLGVASVKALDIDVVADPLKPAEQAGKAVGNRLQADLLRIEPSANNAGECLRGGGARQLVGGDFHPLT